MSKGTVELAGKLSYFSGDLAWLDDVEAAAAALAGGHLEIVTGSISGLDTGGSVVIRASDVDRIVKGASGWGVGVNLIDRGDPVAEDFTVAAFTKDGAWHDLDLSSIVPANATWVLLRALVMTTVGTGYLQIQKKGNANAIGGMLARASVVSVEGNAHNLVPLDATRGVRYYVNAGGTWGTMSLTVNGWVLPV